MVTELAGHFSTTLRERGSKLARVYRREMRAALTYFKYNKLSFL